MEASFWQERWAEDDIAFHQSETNSRLIEYFPKLALSPGSRVFVPLCGKTLDIAWLVSQGYRVAGAELSELAIQQLFAELGLTPKIISADPLIHYHVEHIDIFVGDFFDLNASTLGPVDAIYDRGALIALPLDTRRRYAAHLNGITGNAPQLLITISYDQRQMNGPPFSVIGEEVRQHYGDSHSLMLLESEDIPEGVKEVRPAMAHAWLLRKMTSADSRLT